ncbi:MAG: glucosaminidase domain-containing protein [Sphingobacteriaceae bacterium]|nr:MAG: LysM peptidoglycan-binding domain-containing protein [Pedobacter sp.]
MRCIILSTLLFVVLFSSCGTKRQLAVTKNNNATITSASGSVKTNVVNNGSANGYIERYKDVAIAEMNTYGIPASITLAQGLLESGNGNSSLATQANNHFGIKCTAVWKGKTMLKDDDQKDECFRVYKTPEESFRDHSEFLQRKRYAFLFDLDKNDYKGWAQGLKQAGYATNPRYPELLIGLIQRYSLDQYDRAETAFEKHKREEKIQKEIVQKSADRSQNTLAKAPVAIAIYEVKQGDTLYSIAKRFGLSVEDLKTINSLLNDGIELGQLLLVSK